jgi:hypothetical protein
MARCEQSRDFVEKLPKQDMRLTTEHQLIRSNGVEVPYSTLLRYAVEALGFVHQAATGPVIEWEARRSAQLDDAHAGRRRNDSRLDFINQEQ